MALGYAITIFGASFCIGILGSLVGIGGGTFLVPFLILALEMPSWQAVGISLFCVVGTGIATAPLSIVNNKNLLRHALFLEFFAAIGALVSSKVAWHVPQKVFTTSFGLLLVAISVLIFMTRKTLVASKRRSDDVWQKLSRTKQFLAAFFAFLTGAMSGLFGIGGAIFLVPCMVLSTGLPMKFAVETSLFVMLATGSIALASHFARGDVPVILALIALVGVFPGGKLGSLMRQSLSEHALALAFSFMAIVVGALMIVRTLVEI